MDAYLIKLLRKPLFNIKSYLKTKIYSFTHSKFLMFFYEDKPTVILHTKFLRLYQTVHKILLDIPHTDNFLAWLFGYIVDTINQNFDCVIFVFKS